MQTGRAASGHDKNALALQHRVTLESGMPLKRDRKWARTTEQREQGGWVALRP